MGMRRYPESRLMIRKFYSKVVKYRKIIMVIFALLTICSAIMYPKVYVDYDLVNYLPQESPSIVALDVMEKEFGGDIPSVRVMLRDVSKKEALEYKKKIEAVDGVVSVMWIDSMMPVDLPLDMYPDSVLDSFYKDGNALFNITVDSEKQLEAIPKIYDIIGEDNLMTGAAVVTVVATINTVKEIIIITIIAVLFLLFVLVITTTSWIEPLIVMLGLGIAVVINAGTNLVFGKISFVTNSAGMILQMAVALDYSVFLIHRFGECRKTAEPEEAMTEALALSSSSILSSGLTTIIGFIALATMRFLLGADLGFALSKGVAISLATTLLFMPGVILGTYGLMEKTQHRRLLPSFEGFGRFVCRVTIPLMIAFALLIVPSFIGSLKNEFWYGGSHIYGPDTRVGSDTIKLNKIFGDNDTYVLMVPRGDNSKEYALIRELEDDERVISVLSARSVMGTGIPPELLPDTLDDQFTSKNYDRLVLTVGVPQESERTYKLIEDLRGISDKYYPGKYHLTGTGVSYYDLKTVITSDRVVVNVIAILAVFIVLIFTMKNVILSAILVLTIEAAIWINLALSYVLGQPLFFIAYLIISSVQLGATVDYAILFTQRYRENRSDGLAPRESVIKTIKDNTAAILTSALAVSVMGFLLALFSTQGMIAQVGLLLGRGTLFSLFAVMFVLPGLLMTFDKAVNRRIYFGRMLKKEATSADN